MVGIGVGLFVKRAGLDGAGDIDGAGERVGLSVRKRKGEKSNWSNPTNNKSRSSTSPSIFKLPAIADPTSAKTTTST
eukprot:CAMPEP_0118698180 /NCGR_PEP_ID=MMETSP0800-20121206/15034_1 /TAXON_ID=210618 ORGANISM="Striatella unipunctata, Strain CCMP2910" /NCGR_SAMPLE_ID=MMETSP0800 /ASSEMBLY_ACC=CAM_ASM_000638 /LENGTH=76 /DNA_ID=CAMNT_0006597925 /DNA_START=453 /DNA_END=683 /DNA_ORIENTATION=-